MGRTATEPYLLLDADVFDDDRVGELADLYGPAGPATYIHLLCQAKAQRNCGEVRVAVRPFSRAIGDRREAVERIATWESMIRLGLIELVSKDDILSGEFVVQVVGWEAKQTLTRAEKARVRRAREREQASGPGVSISGTPCTETGTLIPLTDTTCTRQGDREKDLSGTDVPSPTPAKPKAEVIDPERRRAVFTFWMQLFHVAPGNAKFELGGKRDKKVVWALRTYGSEAVAACLRGYASDPWRHEQRSRHELATLLRNEEQVEAGIDKYERAKGVNVKVNELALEDRRRRALAEHEGQTV